MNEEHSRATTDGCQTQQARAGRGQRGSIQSTLMEHLRKNTGAAIVRVNKANDLYDVTRKPD